MKKKPKPRLRVPALDRLEKQIEQLRWLLDQGRYDPKLWKAELLVEVEGSRAPSIELRLVPKGQRPIFIGADADPDGEKMVGRRHFWIDGNHWYDEHAVGTLRERFIEQPEDEDEDEDEDE